MLGFRVFIGSTFEDLQPYRAAVMETLHRLELAVVGMEYFGSQPQAPLDACLTSIQKCQAYLGIFAMRYGSVDPVTGKSITQLEYEEAQRLSLPSLIYLLNEDCQPILPKYVDTGVGAEQLRRLKTELRVKHVVSFFTTPDDLAKRIAVDVPGLAALAGAEVRQSELSKIIAAAPRIDWLNEQRFQFLIGELGAVAEKVLDPRILREVLEYILSGDRQAAVFLLCRTSHQNIREAIDYARDIESKLNSVIERGIKTSQPNQERLGPESELGA